MRGRDRHTGVLAIPHHVVNQPHENVVASELSAPTIVVSIREAGNRRARSAWYVNTFDENVTQHRGLDDGADEMPHRFC